MCGKLINCLVLLVILVNLIELSSSKLIFLNNINNIERRKNRKQVTDDRDKDLWEEIVVSDDHVFQCIACKDRYCHNNFIRWEIASQVITCDPGELCWKGHMSNNTYRGCANRECVPRLDQFANETLHLEAFNTNHCCYDDACNKASIRNTEAVAISFFLFGFKVVLGYLSIW